MLTIRPAAERGHANHGWLDSNFSFSFADNADGLLPEIVRSSNPYGLLDVTITETSLETVFIRLTGHDLRE